MIFLVMLFSSAMATKLAVSSGKVKQDTENTCYFGTVQTVLTILQATTDDFEAAIEIDSKPVIQNVKEFAQNLGALKVKYDNESLTAADVQTFKTKHSSIISSVSGFASIGSKINNGNFSEILDLLESLLNKELKHYPFYTAPDALLWAKYTFTISFLNLASEKSACVSPDAIDFFDKLKADLNQENVKLKSIESDNIHLTNKKLKTRVGFAFWIEVSRKRLKENGGKETLFMINNTSKGNEYLIKVSLFIDNDDKEIYAKIEIGDQVHSIKLSVPCKELLFITVGINKNYDAYDLQISIRQYLANRRDFYHVSLKKDWIEGAMVIFTNKCDIKHVYKVDLIRCSDDTLEIQEDEIETVTQLTTVEIRIIMKNLKSDCKLPPNCDYVDEKKECIDCKDNFFLHQGDCVTKCPDGTYVKDLKECKKCPDCFCTNPDNCTVCPEGKVLYQGECKNKCPNGTWPVKNENGQDECEICVDGCKKCSGEDTCIDCSKGFLINGECKEKCPEGTRPVFNPNKCIPCPEGCASCSSDDVCDKCEEGWFLYKDKCVKPCPDGTYPKDGKCKKCTDNCEECPTGVCEVCKDGYELVNNKCVTKCPSGTVRVSGVCQPCSVDCITCLPNDRTICTKCDAGTYLNTQGECVPECEIGQFVNTDRECDNCMTHCITCENKTSCIKCEDGYLYYENQCIKVCPDLTFPADGTCNPCNPSLNCKTCANDQECIDCNPNKLLENGKCKDKCETIAFKNTIDCITCPENCTACTVNLICTDCATGYFLKEGKCVNDCGDGYVADNSECAPCDFLTCSECNQSADVCDKCIEGFININGVCVIICPPTTFSPDNKICLPCIENCTECINDKVCKVCDAGFVLKEDGTCAETCDDGQYVDSEGKCKDCTNTTCLKCDQVPEECTECPENKYLDGTTCKDRCPNGSIPSAANFFCQPCNTSCKTCETTVDNCTSCTDESMVLDNGKCVYDCPEGKVEIDGKCEPCTIPDCKVCLTDLIRCNECDEGFYKNAEGKCVAECPDRTRPNTNGECQPCREDCIKCPESSTNCTKCDIPKVIVNGVCLDKCPSGTVQVGQDCNPCEIQCLECKASGDCTDCPGTYVLYLGDCIESCPPGFYANSDNECVPCNTENCKTCTNNGKTCVDCISPNVLTEAGECVPVCPDGTRKNSQNKCEPCIVDNCVNCNTDVNTCDECKEGKYKYQGQCTDCPTGTYVDAVKKTCEPCNKDCNLCYDEETCEVCESPKVVNKDGDCVTECPDGQVVVPGEKCEDCVDTNCVKCVNTNLNLCEECKEGFYLLPSTGKCVEVCPTGTYPDAITKRCENCDPECLKCTNADKCIECPIGKILTPEKECKDTCPNGSVKVNDECVTCQTGVECKKCSENDVAKCVQCNEDKIKFEGDCIDECPKGYRELPNKTCEKCPEDCEKCSNPTSCEKCEAPKVKQNGNCVDFCGVGYVEQNKECTVCSDNCAICESADKCKVCDEGFVLETQNGKKVCVEECKNGFYSNGVECKPCKDPKCTGCSTEKNCYECKDGRFVEDESKCVVNCKDGSAPKNGICEECNDPDCKKCKRVEECDECKKPKILHKGECVDNCPPGFSKHDDKCEECKDKCSDCSTDKSGCDECKSPKVIHEDKCVDKCPDGTYQKDGKCKDCNEEDCKKCDSKGKCIDCKLPKVIVDDKCVLVCPEGFYVDDGKCEECRNCKTCNNEGECTGCKEPKQLVDGECKIIECKDGQTLVDGKCKNCEKKHCKECSDIEECDECKSGKVRDPVTGDCVDVCREGYYKKDKECKPCPDDCSECKERKKCEECRPPKVIQNDECVFVCRGGSVSVDGKCEECEVDNCKKCDPKKKDECDVCNTGYKLKDDECVIDCGSGYWTEEKGELGKICHPCKNDCEKCPNAETCDKCRPPKVLRGEDCVKNCEEGEILIGKECVKCDSPRCLRCEPSDTSECIECKPGFFKKDGKCVLRCDDGTYVNNLNECKECNIEYCKVCKDNKSCDICVAPKVLFNNECISKCPEGYTANSERVCVKCEVNKCGKCKDSDLEDCEECKHGFLYQGKCIESCPKGTYEYKYEGSDKKTCLPCDPSCSECKDSKKCINCDEPGKIENGKCVFPCPDGKIKVDGECVNCKDPDCLLCPKKRDDCEKCSPPTVLKDGKCVEECKDGHYDHSGVCVPCKNDCVKCPDKSDCKECKPPKIVYNGNCVEECPPKFYKENGKCEPCNGDCKKCKDLKECEVCESGILHEGKCVDKCPPGFYPCPKKHKCEPCLENCDICPNLLSCEDCKKGFVKQNGKCVEKCSENYIDVNGECKKCDGDCAACLQSKPDYCTECKSPKILHKGDCIDKCPDGTFEKIVDGKKTCADCKSPCKTCEDSADNCTSCLGNLILLEDGTCINKCPDGQVLIKGKCERCTDPSCEKCDHIDLNKCLECKEPKLLVEGKCVTKCSEGQYRDEETGECKPCPQNCKKCHEKDSCDECKNNTYPQEGTGKCDYCLPPKQIIDDVCKSCKVEKCDKCVDGKDDECKTCQADQVLIDGKCHPNCENGYYKNGQECNPCSEGCLICTSGEKCDECDKDKVLFEGKCIPKCPLHYVENEDKECVKCTDQVNCLSCNPKNPDECIICSENSILHEGKCIEECPAGTYEDADGKCIKCQENCQICNKDDCIECLPGSFLDSNGDCKTNCGDGYYEDPITKKCVKCSTENCKECDAKKCNECIAPLKLTLDGKCKSTCEDGSFPDENNICKECPIGCKKCKSADSCDECIAPLKLTKEGECKTSCPEKQVDVNGKCVDCEDKVNCKVCQVNNPGVCDECLAPKFLLAGACVNDCPEGKYKNTVTNTCDSCDPTCQACVSLPDCTKCPEGYVLHEGKCINECPDKYVKVDGTCVECQDENCKLCKQENSGNKCIECENPFLLKDGECVTECPAGYKPNAALTQCEECPTGCSECRINECTRCKKDYFYQNKNCNSVCYDGFIGNCATQICDQCHPSCKTCMGPSSSDCLECASGYLFQDNKCVFEKNCHEGFYPNQLIGECAPCAQSNCKSCLNAQSCKVCKNNYHLKDGACVKNCVMSPIVLGSFIATPSKHVGNVEVVDSENGFVLQNAREVSLFGVIDALNITSSKPTDKTVLLSLFTPSLNLRAELIIDRASKKCGIVVNRNGTEYKVVGASCSDADLYERTHVFGFVSVDLSGNLSLKVFVYTNGVFIENDKTFSSTGITKIGGDDSVISATNNLIAPSQGHRISNAFYAPVVLSQESMDKIVASVPKDNFLSCKNTELTSCKEENAFIVITNGLNKAGNVLDVNDTAVVKFDEPVFKSFTVEVLVENIKANNVFKIYYDYLGFSSKVNTESIALSVRTANTPSASNGVINIPSDVTNDKWVKVIASITTSSQGSTYAITIKNALIEKEYYHQVYEIPDVHSNAHLFNDAKIVSDSAILGAVIHLGSADSIKEVLSSIQETVDDYHCEIFANDTSCTKCLSGYQLDSNGKCQNVLFQGCEEIHSYAEIINNEIVEIDIRKDILDQQTNTYIIRARRLTHTPVSVSQTHSLVSIRSGKNIHALITEEVKPGFISVYQVESEKITINYAENAFGFVVFVIEVNNQTQSANISIFANGTSVSHLGLNIQSINKVVLGDVTKAGINTEFKLNLVCSKTLSPSELTSIVASNPSESDPTCLDVDVSSGKCNKCLNQDDGLGGCKQAVLGFKNEYVSGKSGFSSKVEELIISLKESIHENSSSSHYLVSAAIKTFDSYIIDGRSEIIRLENKNIADTDSTPLNLVTVSITTIDGSSYIVVDTFSSKDGISSRQLTEFSLSAGKIVHFAAAFNVENDTVTVYTSTVDGDTKTVITVNNLEKLQSTGQFSIFGASSNKPQVPIYAEVVSAVVIPNLNKDTVEATVGIFKSEAEFNFKTITETVAGCAVELTQDKKCLKCVSGKELYENSCLDSTAIEATKKGYHVITEGISSDAAASFNVNNPFGESTPSLACHVKLNYIKYDSIDEIIEAGKVKVYFAENEGSIVIKVMLDGNKKVFGPFTYEEVEKYLSIIISFGSTKTIIYIRNSETNTLIKSETVDGVVIPVPETIVITNHDNSKSVANCHLTQENYGNAVISAPVNKKSTCDISSNGKCAAADFGTSNGDANRYSVHIPNIKLIEKESPKVVDIEDIVHNEGVLCSKQYTISFLATLIDANISGLPVFVPLAKVNYGSNYFKLSQNKNDKNQFSFEYKNYYNTMIKGDKDIVIFSLPHALENDSVAVSIVMHKSGIFVIMVMDTPINYIVKEIATNGVQDCITSNASIEFGGKHGNSIKPIISFKNLIFYPEDSSSVSEQFDLALDASAKLQEACRVTAFGQTCTVCETGYSIVADNNGDKVCVPNANSTANNTRKIVDINETSSHTLTRNLSGPNSYIIVSANISSPVKEGKVGLLLVSLDTSVIVEIYSEGTALVAYNKINNKHLEISDVFDCAKGKDFINIILEVGTNFTKLSAYDKSSDSYSTVSNFHTLSLPSAAKLFVKVGYSLPGLSDDFSLKSGALWVNVNGSSLDSDDTKSLAVTQTRNYQSCRDNVSADGYEVCSKPANSDIFVESNTKLFNKLATIVKDYTNANSQSVYSFEVDINTQALLSGDNQTNINVLFALDNSVADNVLDNYNHNDIISEATEGSCRLSLTFTNDRLQVATPLRDIEVLDQLNNVQDYKNIKVTVLVDAIKKTIEIRAKADDLLIKQVVETPEVESISPSTSLFKNPNVHATINISDNHKTSEHVDCDAFKIKKDHCNIDNCNDCILNEEGHKFCISCSNGFTDIVDPEKCSAKTVVLVKKFMP